MTSTIRLEISRVFNKAVIIILISLVIASLYFTFCGISEYKGFLQYKENFIAAEKSKIQLYMNYEQYGAAGFRVMLEPSPLAVFFNRADFVRNLTADIDTSEIVKIYNSRKGKEAFSTDGRFGDMTEFMRILSILFMIMGFFTFPNKHIITFFGKGYFVKTILSRLLLLNSLVIMIFLLNYNFARMSGIVFTSAERNIFAAYSLAALIILVFFYLAGLLIKVLFGYKKSAVTYLLVVWFAFSFGIPEIKKVYHSTILNRLPSVEKLSLEKVETLLEAERENKKYIQSLMSTGKTEPGTNPQTHPDGLKNILKELYNQYMKNGYLENKKKEELQIEKLKQCFDTFSTYDSFSPVDFLDLVSSEASGRGYSAYLDFCYYVQELRDKFMRFCGEKRYLTYETVESFIKESENVNRTPARLPETFLKGVSAPVIYILILILPVFSAALLRRKPLTNTASDFPLDVQPGKMTFFLVNKNNRTFYADIKNREPKNYSVLDSHSHTIINKEVTAAAFIDYTCRQKKINKDGLMAILGSVGLRETELREKLSVFPDESKKKLVFSFAAARGKNLLIDEFIKGVSHEFEKQFLHFLSRAVASGLKVAYISSEMFTPASSLLKRDMDIGDCQLFHLDPQKISLR